MPQKLETVLKKIEDIDNNVNRQLIQQYYIYLQSRDTSTNYQKDNVKLMHMFAKFLAKGKNLYDVKESETIVEFLDIKGKLRKKTQNKNGLLTT